MKKVMIVVLGLALGSSAIAADKDNNTNTNADSGTSGFFESLRQKIELLTPKKKLSTTKSVGGVRGSLADSGELYWKGEKSEQVIDADELAAFEEALSAAEAGNMAAAEKGLAEFLNTYPQSQLRGDAQQALALVKKQPEAAE